MKTYEEVCEMLEMNKSDGEKATLKCWLNYYQKYMDSRVKLAEIKRNFEWSKKHNLHHNEYIIKREEVEVGYFKRCLEMLEEEHAILN
jgi:hypothetical protein